MRRGGRDKQVRLDRVIDISLVSLHDRFAHRRGIGRFGLGQSDEEWLERAFGWNVFGILNLVGENRYGDRPIRCDRAHSPLTRSGWNSEIVKDGHISIFTLEVVVRVVEPRVIVSVP